MAILLPKSATAGVLLLASFALAQEPTRTEKWLQPIDSETARSVSPANPPRALKPSIEHPEPSLAPLDFVPPSLPLAESKLVRPRSLSESPPLTAWLGDLPSPPFKMPEASVAVQSGSTPQDLQTLPMLGQFVRDPVSFADPSWQASMTLILTPNHPERLNPVPFEAWSLPDPSQNARVVRLHSPWTESDKLPVFHAPTGR